MSRLFTTALSAVTMLGLGIVALHYRQQELASQSLTGDDAEAFNLTVKVSSDMTAIAGNALPRLMLVVIVVFVILLLVMIR